MQKAAQCKVVTTFIFTLAKQLRAVYRDDDVNPRDAATIFPDLRKRMIRALWDHGDQKRTISFRMWYPVARGIDWQAIWETPDSASVEVKEIMRRWRSYLWNCFFQAMDRTLTLRLLVRCPGMPGTSPQEADKQFFAFRRNLHRLQGFQAPPDIGDIPIAPYFGEQGGDEGEEVRELFGGMGYDEEE